MALFACQVSASDADYPRLQGRFAEEKDLVPLIAEQAFLSEDRFFIRYREAEQTIYGSGVWADRIQLGPDADLESYPSILPLIHQRNKPWANLPTDTKPVHLLSVDEWRQFRGRLFASIIPTEGKAGLALHLNLDDYFLYHDEEGRFQVVLLREKPGTHAVVGRLDFLELSRRGMPLLETYLQEKGIAARRIGFNTGDVGAYSLPFLYVNLDLKLAVFVRHPPPDRQYLTGNRSISVLQTAGHVISSHSTDIVFRPLSSVFRLFFVTTDTIAETVLPEKIPFVTAEGVPPVSSQPGMNLTEWEALVDKQTGRPASRGNIEYLIDGKEFFTRFIDSVTRAKNSITLRTYIFDNDDYAIKIAELLKRRSREGVDVRVLLDGLGTMISTAEQQETLPKHFQGPASVKAFLEQDSNIEVRLAPNPFLTGDHVKTFIVDQQVAFTGGMNIAREYRYDWHDLMVALQGPVVGILQNEFEQAWAHAGTFGDFAYMLQSLRRSKPTSGKQGYPIRVLFTRVEDPEIFRIQRLAARKARSRIYVENAYFTDDAMLYELARARARGVDVRVIMPLVTDRGPITRNNILAANALLERGVRVYIYPGMSHVKAAIFDGWACLGSANWDRLSFRINKELNIATSHRETVEELRERLFETDFAKSVEVSEPFPVRWSDHLIELFGDYVF